MRSVPSGSFRRITSVEGLWRAWLAYRRGKRRRPEVAAFELDADTRLIRLGYRLRTGRYRPGPYRVLVVQDPKTRLIAAPALEDRILQNALVGDIGPSYERGFLDQNYACCSGRGPHRADLQFLAWTRRFRFRLCLDIAHYFASVHQETLYRLIARRLRPGDDDTAGIVRQWLSAGGHVYRTEIARRTPPFDTLPIAPGKGLPLGGCFSHWSGALYLDGLDHYIKRTLMIPGYLRYMDDFCLFCDDAGRLEDARRRIATWLIQERALTLKEPAAPVEPCSQPRVFLGYRVSRAGLAPGPKMKKRMKRRLREELWNDPDKLTRSLAAWRGSWMTL